MNIHGRLFFVGFAVGLAGSRAGDAARFQQSMSSSETFYHSRVFQGAAAVFADASAERSE